jgi:hypothetical protein
MDSVKRMFSRRTLILIGIFVAFMLLRIFVIKA